MPLVVVLDTNPFHYLRIGRRDFAFFFFVINLMSTNIPACHYFSDIVKIKTFACLPLLPTLFRSVLTVNSYEICLYLLHGTYISALHPFFFLNPSSHFYFFAPLCKNIHFKIMNDLYITTLECRPTHLFLLVFLF